MANAPVKHEPQKHEPPKRDPAKDEHTGKRDPDIVEGSRHEPTKRVVGEPGSLVMPLTEPAVGDKPFVGATSVTGEHIIDGERDPGTIAEEQRRRSEDYENRIGDEDQSRLSPHDRTNQEQDALQHDPNPGRSQQHDPNRSSPPKK